MRGLPQVWRSRRADQVRKQDAECARSGASDSFGGAAPNYQEEITMSKEQENKAIVGRWFTEFWGPTCNLGIVDELAAPDMLLQYSLHEPRRGHQDIKAFM